MGAWPKTMEPQKPGNSPGPGPEVVEIETESCQRASGSEFVAVQCRMRSEVFWDECLQALQQEFSILPILER